MEIIGQKFQALPHSHRGNTPPPAGDPKAAETSDAQILAQLTDFVGTLVSPESLQQLNTIVDGEARTALFSSLLGEIDESGKQRYGRSVAHSYSAEQNRGVWSRAEKNAMQTWEQLGVQAADIEAAIGDVGDKGRFAKIMEVGAGLVSSRYDEKIKGLKGADVPRMQQLQKEIEERDLSAKETARLIEEMKAKHEAALLNKDNEYAVNRRRETVLNGMYAKDAKARIVLKRESLDKVVRAELAERGLTIKAEGDKFLVFNEKGEALQIPGTSRNYTMAEFYAEQAKAYVHVSDANPSNGKPENGLVLGKVSEEAAKRIHKNALPGAKKDKYSF